MSKKTPSRRYRSIEEEMISEKPIKLSIPARYKQKIRQYAERNTGGDVRAAIIEMIEKGC
jgi:hypothetical protein